MSCLFARLSTRVAMVAALILSAQVSYSATGLLSNVPEAAGYTLVYEFPIPASGPGWAANLTTNPYSYNVSASIAPGSFDRVAYYMELVKNTGATQWVYVSMTSFTTNATRLGIPRNYILRHNAYDTANPSNATIRSNVSGISETNGCNTVNLEFWPSNYGTSNDYGVPGASSSTYDCGDGGASTSPGHASMQIHNYGAGQTLFSYSQWGNAGGSNLGLGNCPTPINNGVDWTFDTANISTYSVRTLQILVRSLSLINVAASNVTASSGWMNAQLTIGNSCDVYAYWGDSDQTSNAAAWAHSALVGSYSNGTFNLTRQVAGLSGGVTNWYTFMASNATAVAWASPSANFVTATAPTVDNSVGALTSVAQAVLRGTLTAGGTADIYLYWGRSNGGQSSAYEHGVKLTDVRQGAFSATVSALSGFPYFYVCCASNEAGVAWAPAASSFTLPVSAAKAIYSPGLRGSIFQPVTFSQTAVDLSGASYAPSLTRVFTGTKVNTVLAMSEVQGKNIIFTGPVYSWNEFGGSPGDTFVAALSGRFFPPVTGSYTFRWSQDDRGWLFLDTGDDGVFDSADAVGTYAWDGMGSRTLTAGRGYNFMFFSQESAGGDSLAFWYTPPGGSEVYVNPSVQNGQWNYVSGYAPDVSITNNPVNAGSLTADSATLSGTLSCRNWSFDVYVYWGRTDGQSVPSNWETNAFVGRFDDWSGAVSCPVGGLATNSLYYYRFFITNALMTAWATNSDAFSTDTVTLQALDDSASEIGPDVGTFRVSRPATSTNVALTVNYTLGGSAVNGTDYAALGGCVVIPVGALYADFTVTPFSDAIWQEGPETVVATLAAGNYLVGAPSSAVVTIQDAATSPSAWSLRAPIQFSGYNRTETLTNFPALVVVGPGIPGFSYSQFLSGANGDLRFTDGSMTRELSYEIENWDTNGLSRVWVQIPALTNNASIWMFWRRAGLAAPSYTTSGATWSEGFVTVAHLSEAGGAIGNSAQVGRVVTVRGVPVQAVPGAIGSAVQFDGVDDLVNFGTVGRPYDNFTFSAWLKTSLSHEIDAESTSSTSGTSGQKYAFDVESGGNSSTSAGLSVGTNGLSVYELASNYMPPLAVSSNAIGTGWNLVTVTYQNRQPRIYRNGALVCTGLTSTRSPVYAPYRIGGQVSANYGYFNGFMDEVRISALSRSTNWIWAEYMNAASNGVLATVGACQSSANPEVANLPASGVSSSAATLNGYLSATGMAETAVAVYWGTSDGGTDAGAWANTNWFAAPAAPGAFAKSLDGLSEGTLYFYRFAAANAYGTVWAAATETLLAGAVTLEATDAAAAEEPLDTGAFTVSRGVAQAGPLTVNYALSGTAVNGVDMSRLTGSVTIPAGSATADIPVSPLFNRNYQTRATDTVTLTLSSGAYVMGSPSGGTVTIANWQPSSATGIDVPRNFIAASADPLTGSETLTKTSAGSLYVGGSSGNTFKGDIVVDTDGGLLRVGAIPGAASGIGVALPGMTSANTITVKRGGNFQIEDNVNGTVSSAPNRFGTEGNRPSVALNGGTLTLNGANNATTVPQSFNALSLGAGYSTVTATRNSAGTPELAFANVSQAKGSHVNFTGTSLGAATNNVPRVRFAASPVLVGGGGGAGSTTMSIMPGARYGSEWVTHDAAAGIRSLTSAEYTVPANNDVNAAGATDNVKLTSTAQPGFPGLSADKVINSLNINVGATTTWTPTNKLTLTSGQLISGVPNNSTTINYPSTLTAGSGSSDASLDISVFQNTTYIRSLITDNGSGKVTLTKNGGSALQLDGNVDNTYSGGTYVNEGSLTTGSTVNRRYLGTGPVRVDAATLVLNQAGATANAVGDDYVAVNAGQIQVGTVSLTGDDTFNISAGCVILGSWGMGTGLNALDRGVGVAGVTPNITLAPDAIVAHNFALAAPLDLKYNTVRNLGTNADLLYGIVNDTASPAAAITIGKGTPFKGVSTDRTDRRWSVGTINVTPDTSEVTVQGLARPGTTPNILYLGNWLMAGGPVIAPAGPLTANILGYVNLDDSDATYGDTTAGKAVTFAVKAGGTLGANKVNSMGSGSGVASIRVDDGGTLTLGTPAGINGSVAVQPGGRFVAGNTGGMTGTGPFTFSSGAALELTATTGLTGPQADALAAALPPGVLVRLNVGSFGTPTDPLDSRLGSRSPVYIEYGGNNGAANPLVNGTTIMTLNRDAATGLGGMLVNDYAGRQFPSASYGRIVVGANGGTIAATSNTTFEIQQRFSLGANALTIGATNMLDRVMLPKLGTVYLNVAAGLDTASEGSSITVIPGATLLNAANAIPDESDVIVNGTFLVGGTETIGALGGSGTVNLQANSLTVGRNNHSSTFSGQLTNSLSTAMVTKAGTGRFDITSSGQPYSGVFVVNNGTLSFSGDGSMASPAGTAAYTVSGNGTLLLDNSAVNNRDRLVGESSGVTFQGGTFRFVGKDGEASGEALGAAVFAGGLATIDVANGAGSGSSAEVVFGPAVNGGGTVNFTASNGTLGTPGDNPRVFFRTQEEGALGFATVGGVPAYYSAETGVRALTLPDATEFDGTTDQTGVDTKYTASNNHLALNSARSVNSLWVNSPGAGYSVNLGSSGANNLTLSSGRLSLTGDNDFTIARSGSSSGTLTRSANGTLYLGVGAGRSLTVNVPLANGAGMVEKDGAGTLVLGAASTFTGMLNIDEGTVRYAAGNGGDLSGNAVNVWNSGVLDFSGDTDTLGALSIYSGMITNSAAGGALTVASLAMGGGPAGSSTTVNTGTGSLKLSGNVTYNAVNDPDKATILGKLDLNGGTRVFTVGNSVAPGAAVDLDVAATVVGAATFGVTKAGAGVMKLSVSNSFDGPVATSDGSGTLVLSNPYALGSPTAGRTIGIANTVTFALDGSNGSILFPVLYTNLFLNGAGDPLVGPVRGALANWSGSHTVPNKITLTGNSVYLASLQAGDKLTLSGNIDGTQDLTVNGDGDTELSGAITTGAKSLYKNGLGTLTLSGPGTNGYWGVTTVNAGTLRLAKASGTAPVNALTNGGLLTINSGALVQYAASTPNPDMLGTNGIAINGTGRLDFNGASDGVGTVTLNAYGATADTTNILNTAGGGIVAVNGLYISPAQGYLTRIDSGTGTLVLSNNVTFSAAQTGRAQIAGKLSLGNFPRTFTVNLGTYSNYDLSIDAAISGDPGVGLIKLQTGLLRLSGANSFDGNLTNSSGTVVLANPQALGAPTSARTVLVSSGCSLALDGAGITDPSNFFTLNLNGTGDARNSVTMSGALISLAGSNTVPCAIALAGNTQISSLQAGGKLTLTGAFSGAYTLTVTGPGETALAGANGTVLSATGLTVLSNSVLRLENTALNNNANRIGNAIPITLSGGTIGFANDGGAANFTEALGALTIGPGSNAVFATQAASGVTSALVFASMTYSGGTVNFSGEGLGESARNRIFITGQADGLIGPWATINGTNLAFYSSARGVYAGAGTEIGVAALGGTVSSVIPHNENASAVINTMGSEGPIALEAAWTNRVLEVRQETAYASTVAMTNATATKALQTSRLVIKDGMESLTLGQAPNSGAVMALSSGGTLALENQSASKALTINAAVVNNTTASGLTKFGNGTVVLAGSNSYSGATLISAGNLEVSGSSTQVLAGAISGNGALVKSGSGRLTLGTNNTYVGLTTIKQGTVVANCNNAFGGTAAGTVIESGATLDVGGFQATHALYMPETFIVSGKGVGDKGAIVNNSATDQGNAFGKITLVGDTTFGGVARWDLRANTPVLTMNGYNINKVGANYVMLYTTVVLPNGEGGVGNINVNAGYLRLEYWNNLNGSPANTLSVGSGAQLSLHNFPNLYPAVWTLALTTNATVIGSAGLGSGSNVWSGPVSLLGPAFLSAGSGCSATFTNTLSGLGSVIKGDVGTVYLTSPTNTYAGATIVSNGTLYVKYPGSLPGYNDGRLTVAGGGTLALNSSDGNIGFTAEQLRDLNANSSFKAVNALLSVDTAGADLAVPYSLTRLMGVSKQGTNSLSLGGANTNLGNIAVYAGQLSLSGSNVQQNATCYLEGSTTSNALMRITATGFLCSSNNFSIRNNGALYLDGGTMVRLPDTADGETFGIGYNAGGYGYLKMGDGVLTTTRLYPGRDGVGVVRFSGGTTRINHHIHIGRTPTAWGSVTIDGSATVVQPFGLAECFMAYEGGRAELNIAGGTFTRASTQIDFGNTVVGSTSVVNLCAGRLTTRMFNYITGKAWINFCGATLSAVDTLSPFIPSSTNLLLHSFGSFGSFAGGAVIDSNGKDIAVPAVIRNPTGKGVAAIALSSQGLGYIGEPFVSIEGGSGTGATAIANLADDGTGRGTFKVASLTVTCPGTGYATPPNVLFKGGGYGVVTAQVGTVTLADNKGGGLTKIGAGTLTLSAANTYTGTTTIAEGTLKLGTAAALMPSTPIVLAGGTLDLGGFTVTNLVSGMGTISNGTFATVLSPNGPGALGTNALALGKSTVLSGTYEADVTTDGRSDLVSVQGNIDLSGLDLRVVDTDALDRGRAYTILTCTGSRTGAFKSTNLADKRWHVSYRNDGSVQLVFVNGTLIRLR